VRTRVSYQEFNLRTPPLEMSPGGWRVGAAFIGVWVPHPSRFL